MTCWYVWCKARKARQICIFRVLQADCQLLESLDGAASLRLLVIIMQTTCLVCIY